MSNQVICIYEHTRKLHLLLRLIEAEQIARHRIAAYKREQETI